MGIKHRAYTVTTLGTEKVGKEVSHFVGFRSKEIFLAGYKFYNKRSTHGL